MELEQRGLTLWHGLLTKALTWSWKVQFHLRSLKYLRRMFTLPLMSAKRQVSIPTHPKGWGFLETIHMNFVRVLQSNLREKTNGELCKIF